MADRASPWYSVYRPRPDAEVQLYCLPGAGADATMFRPWADRLPPDIELRAVRLPGRHAPHPEKPFTGCVEAADRLATGLAAHLRVPYVLFGHSMGALLAHQLIGALARGGLPPPLLYVSASWLVEGTPRERLPDPAASDERFVEVLARLGGVPSRVLADQEVLAFTLPVLRADFELCRTYRFDPGAPPLTVPVRAMGGVADRVTPVEEMTGWARHARRFLGTRCFPGDHFFPRDQTAQVLGVLVEDIRAVRAAARAP
ncbi:thioesterase II family protein [Streptomyces anulatus]|uniref:thioesterase II family protein n=1 Tax=Streptomyces anulatus TaxID=1892 RepID=UPI0036C622D5